MESFRLSVPEAAAISPPTVVCVTPVRNERDALERFLPCAATWADHIVLLDQCSVDGSRETATGHPKVRLILNEDPTYDEYARQPTLLEAAHDIPGRRVWQPDYESLARRLKRSTNGVRLSDARGYWTRLVHRWLARTQARAGERSLRLAQRLLIPCGR